MVKLEKNLLQALDLNEMEGKVYLATLELGQATIQEIARKSGVKRSTIYTFMGDMKERGLISDIKKKKRTLYSAAHPAKLVEAGKSRLSELENILPELMAIHNRSGVKPRITFYENLDGIKEIYADTLRERKPIVGWSDYEESKKVLGDYYYSYAKDRMAKDILYRCIARDTKEAREKLQRSESELREVKLSDSKNITTDIYIYGNKVAFINFRSQPLFAVLVEDASIASTLLEIWESMWRRI
jgi:sugar-specific transcriptional regulator TrmB